MILLASLLLAQILWWLVIIYNQSRLIVLFYRPESTLLLKRHLQSRLWPSWLCVSYVAIWSVLELWDVMSLFNTGTTLSTCSLGTIPTIPPNFGKSPKTAALLNPAMFKHTHPAVLTTYCFVCTRKYTLHVLRVYTRKDEVRAPTVWKSLALSIHSGT